jgi:hypothetical protein
MSQDNADLNTSGPRGDDFEIQLVTISPGDALTSWWGHTAIVVEDKRFNTSRFYNYGLFSFEQENFILNFMMGRLIFWVGAWNTSDALAFYASQNRDIRIQVLDLTPEKKIEMVTFLANNVLPENREYLYDHYRDNCSTRVRDIIDNMVGGQFYKRTQMPGPLNFRQHTRRHTDQSFIIDWVLMFLMNNSIDQDIRQWDEMFLPEELERYVSDLTYQYKSSEVRPLVKNNYIYYKAKDRNPLPNNVPAHWPKGLLIGLTSAAIAVFLGLGYWKKKRWSKQFFAVYHIIIGFIYGIPGLVLFFMSFFTDHIVTYQNENLLLANPFTFLLIPLGIGLMTKGTFSSKWLPWLWYLHLGLHIILLFLKIFPAFDQFNWLSIAMIAPLSTGMSLSWYLVDTKD